MELFAYRRFFPLALEATREHFLELRLIRVETEEDLWNK